MFMNDDLYNEYIERRGRQYRYDPDYDCYYAVPVEMSGFDKYAWIITIVVLSICVWALS
jgi:hypothetical protein